MLKNLLSTLIEAVFTNKKRYISNQAFPADTARTNLELVSFGEYVAPSDGFFGFYAENIYSFDVYSNQGNGISTRSVFATPSTFNFIGGMVIPVAKGCSISYRFSGMPKELWFIQSAGYK